MQPKTQQSLLDILLRVMPGLKIAPRNAKTDPKTAKALYELWSNESARVSDKTFRTGDSLKKNDVRSMSDQGLITVSGDKVEITKRGGEIIKQMILGDDRSVYEDNGNPLDYHLCLANLKPTRLRKSAKVASSDGSVSIGSNWYMIAKHGL